MALKLVWTWREELREGKDATFYEGEARRAVEGAADLYAHLLVDGHRVIFTARIVWMSEARLAWKGSCTNSVNAPDGLYVAGPSVEAVKAAIEAAAVYLPIVATVWEDE